MQKRRAHAAVQHETLHAKCEGGARQVCGADGTWGAAETCDVACHPDGKACLAPVQLAAGSLHACARMSDGTVWCWGSGSSGQLGNGTTEEQLTPKPVADLSGVTELWAEHNGTCAQAAGGIVSCWGANVSKMLQNSDDAAVLRPKPLDMQNLKGVTLGDGSSCVLTDGGDLLCKGANKYANLGNVTDETAPIVGVDSNVYVAPAYAKQVAGLLNVISAPTTHYAVRDDGRVLCWGLDSYGYKLEHPALPPMPEAIFCAGEGIDNGEPFRESRIVVSPVLLPQLVGVL
jgi:alpha-tubulin suppressor-like RCC1 family protein